MEVAIMGAGLAGLACAVTLEKQGITPAVFEKRGEVGDRFVSAEAMLTVLTAPINDAVRFFSETHGIPLRPAANIRRMVIRSRNEKAEVEGRIGFTHIRGRHPDALEKQLERQLRTTVRYRSDATYEGLLREYSHVVLATGDAAYSRKIQPFRTDVTVSIKGVNVQGRFDRYTPIVWLGEHIAPKGYAYLLPYSEDEANLVLAVPDNLPLPKCLDTLWDRLYAKAQHELQQELPIEDHFQIERYEIGYCPYPRIGNTYFTGNCLGAVMPFLGYGQFASLLSGIYAALDLGGKGQYDRLVRPIQNSYRHSLVLRRIMEKVDDLRLDGVVKQLNRPYVQRMLFGTPVNPLKVLSYLVRPLV